MITVWLMVIITIHRYVTVCTPGINKKWTSVRAVMIQVGYHRISEKNEERIGWMTR